MRILLVIIAIIMAVIWIFAYGGDAAVPWPIPFVFTVSIILLVRSIWRSRQLPQEMREPLALDPLFKTLLNSSEINMHINLQITREEAMYEAIKSLTYTVRQYCRYCNGTRVSTGGQVVPCTTCGGQGKVSKHRQTVLGQVTNTRPCPKCKGLGATITLPCLYCSGRGYEDVEENVTITIPPGAKGQQITLSGKGHYIDSKNRGDLIVDVFVVQ